MRTTSTGRSRVLRLSAAAAALTLLAACGSADGSDADAGGGIPPQIKLVGVHDRTGPVAYAGDGAARGGSLAVRQINEGHFLGKGVKLQLGDVDTAGSIEKASSEMTRAAADPDVAAVIGPTQAQQAATVAPLVERSKLPTVFTQAGAEGVVTGDYTFRATAPMSTYYDLAAEYLAKKHSKKVGVLYNSTFTTFAELGKESFPVLAAKNGLDIVSSTAVQSSTQDFTTPVQTVAARNPDALVMFLTAPQSVTALTQLRQAGYSGQVVATSVQGAGNVVEAGKSAKGLVYPTDFSPAQQDEKAKRFVKDYTAKYGKQPDPYAAEGYDAVWWIARAIKASDSATRDGIQKGLQKVAEEGFAGAMGKLTFEGNDMRVPGVLVRWDGAGETLVGDE
jgi:branched-chain amino acid transport system substrate-binding protein